MRWSKLDRQALKADKGVSGRFLILTPVLDDWDCLRRLLGLLDAKLTEAGLEADLLAVDDGSTAEPPEEIDDLPGGAVKRVMVLRLTRNVGHQRAIAIALPLVRAHLRHRAVIVMDADGEDRPEDVIRFMREHLDRKDQSAIFARRTTRSEGPLFRCCYFLYRMLFRLLAGQDVRIGNFSLLPRGLLPRVVSISEIWNHYSAGVRRARLPCVHLPCPRGARLAGRSRMNIVSLVTHGLNGISVYGDVVGTRALLFFSGLSALCVLLAVVTVVVRLATDWAIPGWATNAFGLALILLLQSVTLSTFFIFTILSSRNNQAFLPSRDHRYFLSEFRLIPWAASAESAFLPSAGRARRLSNEGPQHDDVRVSGR